MPRRQLILNQLCFCSRQRKNKRKKKKRSSALTNKSLPTDKIPRLTKQINTRIRNLPHSPIPPQRHPPLRPLTPLLPRQAFHPLRSLNRSRRNNITRHAPGAEFDRCGMREGVNAGFGDGDVRLEGHGCVVDCGGDEDDAAACADVGGGVDFGFVGGGGCDEVGQGSFEGVVGAEDVDVDDGFEGVGGELIDGGEEVACCAGTATLSVNGNLWWFDANGVIYIT